MKDLFSPYELALKLKEIGFNEPCFGHYYNNGEYFVYNNTPINYELNSNKVSVPLYQQIVDWFRINHNLHISIRKENSYYYGYEIVYIESINRLKINYTNRDYYEALNEAIEEALKLIK